MKTDLEKAKGYIYRLIGIRPRSEKEIRVRLREKGYSNVVAEEAIGFFKEEGIIDDLEFARAWVDSRMRLKPKGDIVLSYELRNKGVSEGIIEKVLKDARTNISEQKQVEEIIMDLKEKNKGLASLNLRKKIYSHLMRRGFRYDIIKDCMNEVLGAR